MFGWIVIGAIFVIMFFLGKYFSEQIEQNKKK
jgi:hypothetical protein